MKRIAELRERLRLADSIDPELGGPWMSRKSREIFNRLHGLCKGLLATEIGVLTLDEKTDSIQDGMVDILKAINQNAVLTEDRKRLRQEVDELESQKARLLSEVKGLESRQSQLSPLIDAMVLAKESMERGVESMDQAVKTAWDLSGPGEDREPPEFSEPIGPADIDMTPREPEPPILG